MKKKRRVRKQFKILVIVILLCCIGGLGLVANKYLGFISVKSANQNANHVIYKHCMAFYPEGSLLKEEARKMCEGQEKGTVVDYQIEKIGEYNLIKYEDKKFLLDNDMRLVQTSELSDEGLRMLSDYLRYTLKAKELDYAYTLNFLDNSTPDKLKDFKCFINGDNYSCYFEEYDETVNVPLKYIGKEIGLAMEQEKYITPIYVSPERKMMALTFDDGPSLNEECTEKIIDELYKYNANATFFVLGNKLYDKVNPLLSKSINLGNQYGSHSCSHTNLKKLERDEMYSEVMDVADYFKENFDYDMTIYRPPYGSYNSYVDEFIPLPAVLWDIDSMDWDLRDGELIYQEIIKDVGDKRVIIMHDIYDTSAEALVDLNLIRDMIDDGYQLVTVDEIAKAKGVVMEQGTHLCWD